MSQRLQDDLKLRRLNRPGLRYCPWMDATSRGITVHLVDMPGTTLGLTDGKGIVWMDRYLLDYEARCTLAHELIHIERGHTRAQPADVEREVNEEAARRLIAAADLAQARQLYTDPADIAAHLLVTPEMLAHIDISGQTVTAES